VPALPEPDLDLAQDPDGYSAELSVERDLAIREIGAFSAACLHLRPVACVSGESEVRGLVSVDDETLWVYVHEVGPGKYGPTQANAARDLLEHLWRTVHEAAAADRG
jgi:hypothetical protein